MCGQRHDEPFILRVDDDLVFKSAGVHSGPFLGPCFSCRKNLFSEWADVLTINGSPNQAVCQVKSFKDIAVGFYVPEDLRNSNEFLAGNETFHLKKMEVFAVANDKEEGRQRKKDKNVRRGKKRQ